MMLRPRVPVTVVVAAQTPRPMPPPHAAVPPLPPTTTRRAALASTLALLAAAVSRPAAAAAAAANTAVAVGEDEAKAFAAYAARDFEGAKSALTRLLEDDGDGGSSGGNPRSAGDRARLLEMRAAASTDNKQFPEALRDYDAALGLQAELTEGAAGRAEGGGGGGGGGGYDAAYRERTARARLLAGRALAREGVSDWAGALSDYDAAAELAALDGAAADPYVLNSRGNCLASLGRWREARQAYLEAAELFQGARGFRGRGGSTTARLDGAVFAASNAALALAQLGDEPGAIKEAERVARRAPGSADMRAALAALLYADGRRAEAEGSWEFVCSNISVGCGKYRDFDWLARVRRWPPVMVERMRQFLAME